MDNTFGFGGFGGFGESESGQFSFFPTEPAKTEKKAEKKAKASEKKPKAAAARKGADGETLKMPIALRGFGFTETITGDGEMTVKQVLESKKDTYKGLSVDAWVITVDKKKSTIFLKPDFYQAAAADDAMGDKVTISFGQMNVEYSASDVMEGKKGDEVPVSALIARFVKDYPAFEGMSLILEDGIGIPAFNFTERALPAKEDQTYEFYTESGVTKLEGEPNDVKSTLLEGEPEETEIKFKKSDSGYFFFVYEGKTRSSAKAAKTGTKAAQKIIERFTLPFEIYVERYDISRPVTADDFNGAGKVSKKEICEYLKKDTTLMESCPSLKKLLSKEENKQDMLFCPANSNHGDRVSISLAVGKMG